MDFGLGTLGWKRLGFLLVVSQASACSFIFEPAPGSANELRPDGKGRRCGRSFWYPVGDASIATTAATWAAGSNDDPDTQSNRSQRLRIAGWVGVGVFGASAIYGFVVEGRCALLRKGSEPKAEPPAAARPSFPGSVFGFGFRMRAPELSQLCRSKGGQWTMEGVTGNCQMTRASTVTPGVRIRFDLGVPSEIRTRYFGAAQTSNRDYQALASGLRKLYGPPQVEASALTAECQASLAQCLESGARPTGPVWHWPGGTIELTPHWEGTRTVLDIRYAREEM